MLFRKNLHERVNFNPLKDAMYCIWILPGKLLSLSLGLKLKNHQAAGLVRERTCEDDAALLC